MDPGTDRLASLAKSASCRFSERPSPRNNVPGNSPGIPISFSGLCCVCRVYQPTNTCKHTHAQNHKEKVKGTKGSFHPA